VDAPSREQRATIAIPNPMTAPGSPERPSNAAGRRLVASEDEQRRLDPPAEDDGEGKGREGVSAADQRVVDTLLQLTLTRAPCRRIQKIIQVSTPTAS
jgi:hypothetical protein